MNQREIRDGVMRLSVTLHNVRRTAETSNYTNNRPRNYTVQFYDGRQKLLREKVELIRGCTRVCMSVCLCQRSCYKMQITHI